MTDEPASEACQHPGSARREGRVHDPAPPHFFYSTLVAWLVILLLVGVVLARNSITRQPAASGPAKSHESRRSLQADQKLQARYFVGLKSLGLNSSAWSDQIRSKFQTTTIQQLALVALLAELDSPETALAELVGIETVTDQETQSADLLNLVLQGETLDDDDAQALVDHLGWFGKLALSQADEATHEAVLSESIRTAVGLIAVFLVGMIGILLGLALASGAVFAAYFGWVAVPKLDGDHGGIYAETFAVYMSLFLGVTFLASLSSWGEWSLSINAAAMLLSLVALAWPRLRGLSWPQMKQDLGLSIGWLDIPAGLAAYLSVLPLLVVGLCVTLVLMAILGRLGIEYHSPSHPVGELAAAGASSWVWVQIFFIACVAAPVVEELFFRGVLYAHLRRIGPSWPMGARTAFAVAASSFLFAVIHPQGWLAVPVLSSIATALALTREWTGRLGAGMIAHALNNAVAMLILMLLVA